MLLSPHRHQRVAWRAAPRSRGAIMTPQKETPAAAAAADPKTAASAQRKSWRAVLKIHPAADLFPSMSKEDLITLGEDIKTNGMLVPIVMFENTLHDGRNRLDAMEMVGLDVICGDVGGATMFAPEVRIRWAKETEDHH